MLSRNRTIGVMAAFTLVIAAFVMKLFAVQVAPGFGRANPALIRQSVEQREQRIVLDSGRGDFYDRNGEALTGTSYQALLIFPNREQLKDRKRLAEAAKLLGVTEQQLVTVVKGLKTPAWWQGAQAMAGKENGGQPNPLPLSAVQAVQLQALYVPGLTVTSYRQRYGAPYDAAQLLGYIGENPERIQERFASKLESGQLSLTSRIGGAGLEKTFQPYLQGIGGKTLSLFVDGQHNPLAGLDLRVVESENPYYPTKVTMTLSLTAQRRIETLMDKLNVREGSVVVLDTAHADIVAMANRPRYNPNDVDLASAGWRNMAIKASEPGSVFKTVVAAAALDEGLARPDEVFECDGEYGKYGFSCWLKGGHGRITLAEAFAQSCNITFAKLALRIPPETLAAYAKKLGVLSQVGWEGDAPGQKRFLQLDGEEGGQLFAAGTRAMDEGVRIQTAIGQRDVRMTPLAAANMVVTLLNGGVVREPRAVADVRYQTGRLLFAFPEKIAVSRGHGISPKTASVLRGWMTQVVDHGTGKALQSAKWKLAGKSGTAQVADSATLVNQWFVGYGPTARPQYAAAVMLSHTTPLEAGLANTLFKGVMDILADEAGHRSGP